MAIVNATLSCGHTVRGWIYGFKTTDEMINKLRKIESHKICSECARIKAGINDNNIKRK